MSDDKKEFKSFKIFSTFVSEIFNKKLEAFRRERQRIQRKGIPLSENLQKINTLVDVHLKELGAAMLTFRIMRSNIEKLIADLEEDNQSLEVIQDNLKNLDYVLNKIVFLKSHAINMMFKDAVVIKNEQLN